MKTETQLEALGRRVRYASEHPIEGLLSPEELAAIRERDAEQIWLDGKAYQVMAEAGMLSDEAIVAEDRRKLLRHIEALTRPSSFDSNDLGWRSDHIRGRW